MPRIEGYRFGHLVVDGEEQTRDVIVLPERVLTNWWRADGHRLVLADLGAESRQAEEGQGWRAEYEGIVFGLHERRLGPGDRFSLPYFAVAELAAAVERVRALGGEIVHPGERWVICRDCEGTPFGSPAPGRDASEPQPGR